jgi:hypothetical protein
VSKNRNRRRKEEAAIKKGIKYERKAETDNKKGNK